MTSGSAFQNNMYSNYHYMLITTCNWLVNPYFVKQVPQNCNIDAMYKVRADFSSGLVNLLRELFISRAGFGFWFCYFLFYFVVLSSRHFLLPALECSRAPRRPGFPPQHRSHISLVSTVLFPASLHLHLIPSLVSEPALLTNRLLFRLFLICTLWFSGSSSVLHFSVFLLGFFFACFLEFYFWVTGFLFAACLRLCVI